ncbi:Slam-dependent surface lipoprotein [Rodentibacter caecimuris]|uniref:Slam-dependent surface lipoprotein n=1 Tax=Rodentibacter caecimuris TaxID=1796644 RepID=UPI0009C8133C|nr:hypothetical protein BKG97_01700 [Rodentibacter heylii]
MVQTKVSLAKFGFTALAALIISACGSSGGSAHQPQQNNASNNTQTSQPINKSSDDKPADNKSADNKSSDNKSSDNKSSDNKSSDNKPADNKSSDDKPSDNKPSDNKPSDNKPSDNKPSDNKPSDSKPSDNKPSDNTLPQQEKNGTGTVLVVSESDDNVSRQTKILNHYNPTTIKVDGVDITIGLHNFNPDTNPDWMLTSVEEKGRELKVCCGRYSDIRFGVSDPLDENSSNYMFYNGNPTKNMPTSGVATYSGESIISAGVQVPDDTDYYIGSSKFNVDFGNKTLNGALEVQNIQPININARISGNAFSGTANSASLPSSGNVEGKFYGNNAKEMAGLAQGNDKSWGAAFGAQKK